MSLILEALKKLEREKKAPERGFLVTTGAAWPARGGPGAAYVLAGFLLAAAGGALAWLALGGAGRPQPGAAAVPLPPSTTLPAAPATTSPSAPAAMPLAPPPLPAPRLPRRPAAAKAAPAPSPEPSPEELRLEAVSQRDGRPVAVLSGRLVHEGDAFENVRVIRIGSTEVEIEVDGQRRVLGF